MVSAQACHIKSEIHDVSTGSANNVEPTVSTGFQYIYRGYPNVITYEFDEMMILPPMVSTIAAKIGDADGSGDGVKTCSNTDLRL